MSHAAGVKQGPSLDHKTWQPWSLLTLIITELIVGGEGLNGGFMGGGEVDRVSTDSSCKEFSLACSQS